jgi:glucuronoarabinoxylan endo-1,4-beta-xylanase
MKPAGPDGATDSSGSESGGVATGGGRNTELPPTTTLVPKADAGGVAGPGSNPPDAGTNAVCTIVANSGSATDGDANIDAAAELQRIAGFGGMDGGFYAELTAAQADSAFGNGTGQLGLSIIRIRVPEDETKFGTSLAAAQNAVGHGAIVMATPWTPPANQKSNASTVAGSLNVASYGAYADHLIAFRDFMQSNGVPIYALSVQNEPDIKVTYESCDWTANQLLDWVKGQGSKFGDTKLIAAESFHFDHALTDPILNDAAAAAQVDIIAGHIYGSGLADYPLARQRGKEVWMTEHYTESANSANAWPLALDVGTEVQKLMAANFSAYVWWAIRRSYGLLTEDGQVSKRGYVLAQFSKFIRPGYTRIQATNPNNTNVAVTAYKGGNQVVVVAVNRSAHAQSIEHDVFNGCATGFSRFTTSATKNVAADDAVALQNGRATVSLDAQSITTFVSQ